MPQLLAMACVKHITRRLVYARPTFVREEELKILRVEQPPQQPLYHAQHQHYHVLQQQPNRVKI